MKDRFTNEYIAIAFGVMLFASGMMILLIKNWKPYVGGWVFGCLIAMAMFKLMFFTFSRAVEKTERGASVFVGVHYFLRLTLYAVVLAVSAKAEYLSLATTFLGLLSIKYVILIRNMFDYLRSKKGGRF